jgi:hypothetical protein
MDIQRQPNIRNAKPHRLAELLRIELRRAKVSRICVLLLFAQRWSMPFGGRRRAKFG